MDTKEFYEKNYESSPLKIESIPCLFMVDFQMGAFQNFADNMAKDRIGYCISLLEFFRAAKLPIVHFWLDEKKWIQRNALRRSWKNPFISSDEILPFFRANEGELVIEKPDRSCFFGTEIEHFLIDYQIQNIVLAGATTSGCIRSTVTHGDMIGYTMILPEECIWDQSKKVHEANMFDMKYKYAQVWSLVEIQQQINNQLSE